MWKNFVLFLASCLAGCAGGEILNRPNADSATFAKIKNHALDKNAVNNSPHNYPYADVDWVWPLWSYEGASDSKSFLDQQDILLTEG